MAHVESLVDPERGAEAVPLRQQALTEPRQLVHERADLGEGPGLARRPAVEDHNSADRHVALFAW